MIEMSFREVIRETMREEMKIDKNIFIIGTDVGPYGGEFRVSGNLHSEFGEMRVKDTPISEQGIIGLSLGAAITGCRPIAEIPFNDFITMPMDQIVNQVAKFRYTFGGQCMVPMVIRTAIGGYIRAAEQHSQCLEAWFVHVPGLKVVAPSTHYDVRGLLKSAIRENNPVIFIEHKFMYPMKGMVPEDEYTIPLGVADIKKAGKDVTLISYSYLIHKCLNVADKLEKEGISVEVVDPRTLSPLDKETILGSVKKTGRAVVAHEAHLQGGVGAEIAAVIADEGFEYLDAPVRRVGAKNVPIPFPSVLEDAVLPQEDDIEKALKSIL
ncbi:MAG: alpha-ketoacid dehydrogenase subunit beta [Actinobacteria bacterium]|nr:alpha-ketoacid dehydrogenase subunit beta [Actinomycetota bacterium]